MQVWYHPDNSTCWQHWHSFGICADNPETGDPVQQRLRLGLGQPNVRVCDPTTNRPYRIGTNFQVRIQITGACKFMGAVLRACPSDMPQFAKPICKPLCDIEETVDCEPCKNQGECLTFPLVFYNLDQGTHYTNQLLSFQVECPDGTTRTVYVAPGTVNYDFPVSVGFRPVSSADSGMRGWRHVDPNDTGRCHPGRR